MPRLDGERIWHEEIVAAIRRSGPIILLISSGFLRSNYITTKELPIILERKNRDQVAVLPIIIKPCEWKNVPV
jgi:hypothetical protein